MDPRPYHFDYRRPRLSNPTFQSSHLYDSIYQIPQAQIPSKRQNSSTNSSNEHNPQMKRAASTDLNSKKQTDFQNISYRYKSRQNLEQPLKVTQSKMANYGNSIMRNISMDQTQIYKRQEKDFNIISYYPKEFKPNLRQFPKLTLEDKLLERTNNSLHQLSD